MLNVVGKQACVFPLSQKKRERRAALVFLLHARVLPAGPVSRAALYMIIHLYCLQKFPHGFKPPFELFFKERGGKLKHGTHSGEVRNLFMQLTYEQLSSSK